MSNHELIRFKRFVWSNQLNCVISNFFELHLILHACVQRFDVMGTVDNFLGTKQGVNDEIILAFS